MKIGFFKSEKAICSRKLGHKRIFILLGISVCLRCKRDGMRACISYIYLFL